MFIFKWSKADLRFAIGYFAKVNAQSLDGIRLHVRERLQTTCLNGNAAAYHKELPGSILCSAAGLFSSGDLFHGMYGQGPCTQLTTQVRERPPIVSVFLHLVHRNFYFPATATQSMKGV